MSKTQSSNEDFLIDWSAFTPEDRYAMALHIAETDFMGLRGVPWNDILFYEAKVKESESESSEDE